MIYMLLPVHMHQEVFQGDKSLALEGWKMNHGFNGTGYTMKTVVC